MRENASANTFEDPRGDGTPGVELGLGEKSVAANDAGAAAVKDEPTRETDEPDEEDDVQPVNEEE